MLEHDEHLALSLQRAVELGDRTSDVLPLDLKLRVELIALLRDCLRGLATAMSMTSMTSMPTWSMCVVVRR